MAFLTASSSANKVGLLPSYFFSDGWILSMAVPQPSLHTQYFLDFFTNWLNKLRYTWIKLKLTKFNFILLHIAKKKYFISNFSTFIQTCCYSACKWMYCPYNHSSFSPQIMKLLTLGYYFLNRVVPASNKRKSDNFTSEFTKERDNQ